MAAIPFNAAMMQALAQSSAADGQTEPTEEIFKDAKVLLSFLIYFLFFVRDEGRPVWGSEVHSHICLD